MRARLPLPASFRGVALRVGLPGVCLAACAGPGRGDGGAREELPPPRDGGIDAALEAAADALGWDGADSGCLPRFDGGLLCVAAFGRGDALCCPGSVATAEECPSGCSVCPAPGILCGPPRTPELPPLPSECEMHYCVLNDCPLSCGMSA